MFDPLYECLMSNANLQHSAPSSFRLAPDEVDWVLSPLVRTKTSTAHYIVAAKPQLCLQLVPSAGRNGKLSA